MFTYRIFVGPAVAIVLLLGLSAFLSLSGSANSQQVVDTSEHETVATMSPSPVSDTSEQKSLKELLELGFAQQCRFSSSSDNSKISGIVYVGSGEMRGDLIFTISEQTANSHLVVDEEVLYMWVDGQDVGLKMSTEKSQSEVMNDNNIYGDIDIDKKADYSCISWKEDSSFFTLPSNVQFSEI